MKIAIPTNNKGKLDDSVAKHFGQAKNYLIYDTKTENFEVYPNPEVTGGKELPPDFLNRQKVDTVIIFSLGSKAYQKFKDYHIKMFKSLEKSILKNIKALREGKLKNLNKKDIF